MTAYTEASEIVPTPLGAVSVRVTGGSGVLIEVMPVPVPQLPEGMAVDGVKLVRVGVEGRVSRDSPLKLIVTVDLKAVPEDGQYLNSIECHANGGILQVAVRDNYWLEAKGIVAEPVAYQPHGLLQTVREAPAGIFLYVSVAWRAIEGDLRSSDGSTWFAADLALP